MKTATFIKSVTGKAWPKGDARLYRLSHRRKSRGCWFNHVVVSAVASAFDTQKPETYIFPTTSDGTVLNWGNLDGSFQGDMNHERALKDAGYTVK